MPKGILMDIGYGMAAGDDSDGDDQGRERGTERWKFEEEEDCAQTRPFIFLTVTGTFG